MTLPSRRARPSARAVAAALASATVLALAAAPRAVRAQRLVGAAAAGSPLRALPAPVPLDTAARFRTAAVRVGDDVFVAGQPTERALEELRTLGVTTIVNLRTPEEMRTQVRFDEAAAAARLGMRYVTIPMRGDSVYPYAPAAVARFTEAVRGAEGKVLLHCTIGWRASHLWAAYLVAERGVPVDSALAHARAINLLGWRREGSARQPVEELLGRALPGFDSAAPAPAGPPAPPAPPATGASPQRPPRPVR